MRSADKFLGMNRIHFAFVTFIFAGCTVAESPVTVESPRPLSASEAAMAPARRKQDAVGLNRRTPTTKERRSDGLFQILLIRLHSSDPAERTCAATDMGSLLLSRDKLIPPLVQALKYDESKWVRRAAAKSLGKIGSRAVIQPLTEALRDRDRWVAHSAANALKALRASA